CPAVPFANISTNGSQPGTPADPDDPRKSGGALYLNFTSLHHFTTLTLQPVWFVVLPPEIIALNFTDAQQCFECPVNFYYLNGRCIHHYSDFNAQLTRPLALEYCRRNISWTHPSRPLCCPSASTTTRPCGWAYAPLGNSKSRPSRSSVGALSSSFSVHLGVGVTPARGAPELVEATAAAFLAGSTGRLQSPPPPTTALRGATCRRPSKPASYAGRATCSSIETRTWTPASSTMDTITVNYSTAADAGSFVVEQLCRGNVEFAKFSAVQATRCYRAVLERGSSLRITFTTKWMFFAVTLMGAGTKDAYYRQYSGMTVYYSDSAPGQHSSAGQHQLCRQSGEKLSCENKTQLEVVSPQAGTQTIDCQGSWLLFYRHWGLRMANEPELPAYQNGLPERAVRYVECNRFRISPPSTKTYRPDCWQLPPAPSAQDEAALIASLNGLTFSALRTWGDQRSPGAASSGSA
uniref:CUB domain-containing protein n=1 Tax=Macrostomum lignano TaxID=282301 RepID=A0A1I8FK51_9PLAT